jgi:hypothetical protein
MMSDEMLFLACYIWIEHTYHNHVGYCEKDKSETHIRYSFYFSNESTPFYVLESSLENPVIREWVRFDNVVTFHRIGKPIVPECVQEQIKNVLFNTTKFEWIRV